jgi:AcrR family transcriptional regulator
MTTAARHNTLRTALLAASRQAIDQHGLSGLKARDVAQAAGCSLGAIYLVFPDLDALILAVNDATLVELDTAISAALDCPGTPVDTPAEQLVRLEASYLDYALAHPLRWSALFTHRLPVGRTAPAEYLAHQARLFSYVEKPLAALRPSLTPEALAYLARTVFSAVHGVVSLGLDQKLTPMLPELLHEQLRLLVLAIARGLDETTR